MRILADFHGEAAAREAMAEFERVHSGEGVPAEVPEFRVGAGDGKVFLPGLLVAARLAKSNSEAMRIIGEGGVRIDGVKVERGTRDIEAKPGETRLLKRGTRHFARIVFE